LLNQNPPPPATHHPKADGLRGHSLPPPTHASLLLRTLGLGLQCFPDDGSLLARPPPTAGQFHFEINKSRRMLSNKHGDALTAGAHSHRPMDHAGDYDSAFLTPQGTHSHAP
jgi:hypothetical protein